MFMLMLRLLPTPHRSLLRRSRAPLNTQHQCPRFLHQNGRLHANKSLVPEPAIEISGDAASTEQDTARQDQLAKARPTRTTTRRKPATSKAKEPTATPTPEVQSDPEQVKLDRISARNSKFKKDAAGSSKPKRIRKKAEDPAPQKSTTVTDILSARYGGTRRRNPLGDTRRVNIVSHGLCDDILERMKPSLAKHAGCDILDINPGAAVWSSKLHEFLKPRTHILMEPDYKLYEPLLQPLLDSKDSKYVLYRKSGIVWAHIEKVLSKEYLPFQEALATGDPGLKQPNDTLLVVANFAYNPKKPFRGFSSLTTLVLHQLMTAVRANSLFQKYGLIRMLIWVTDEERLICLPRHVALRKKSSIEAEVSCGNISEVASSTRQTGYFRREESVELEQARQVMKKMDESGITTPPNRLSVAQEYFSTSAHAEGESAVSINNVKKGEKYLKELEDLESKFAAGKFSKLSDTPKAPRKTHMGPPTLSHEYTPEFVRLRGLRYRKVVDERRNGIVGILAERHAEIMDLQRQIHQSTDPNMDLQREELERLTKELKVAIANIPGEQTRQATMSAIDNQRFLRQDPPALLFDRREVEPLKVSATEFYPHHELALLDFQPGALWPVLRENYPANYDVLEYIISTMHMFPNQSVRSGLKSLWPGAYEWLIKECAILTDPTRGGDQDLDMLPVRCVTSGMFREMLEAWTRWPWRPSRYELLGRLSAYGATLGEEEMPLSGDAEGG